MPKLTSLDDLLVHELRDSYQAESQILGALPRMTEAATHLDLKTVFDSHQRQTEGHVRRLERVFTLLGVPVRGNLTDSVSGLLEEARRLMSHDAEPEVMDLALIAATQKVKHIEIAGYGCLCTYAEMLGYDQAHDLFSQTLDEEETTDMILTELAEAVINSPVVEGDRA